MDGGSHTALAPDGRECLPHLPASFRRQVLIQCNMNVDAAVERYYCLTEDGGDVAEMAAAE